MIWARGFQFWGWALETQAVPICPCSHCADGIHQQRALFPLRNHGPHSMCQAFFPDSISSWWGAHWCVYSWAYGMTKEDTAGRHRPFRGCGWSLVIFYCPNTCLGGQWAGWSQVWKIKNGHDVNWTPSFVLLSKVDLYLNSRYSMSFTGFWIEKSLIPLDLSFLTWRMKEFNLC